MMATATMLYNHNNTNNNQDADHADKNNKKSNY